MPLVRNSSIQSSGTLAGCSLKINSPSATIHRIRIRIKMEKGGASERLPSSDKVDDSIRQSAHGHELIAHGHGSRQYILQIRADGGDILKHKDIKAVQKKYGKYDAISCGSPSA